MKEIPLTQGKVAFIDDEDFDRVNKYKWFIQSGRHTDYAATYFEDRSFVYMHRFIMDVIEKEVQIDHRNHNGLNNQKSNLRSCNDSENRYNMRNRDVGSSKYRGVDWVKKINKWRARVNKDKKANHVGVYNSEKEAALAYNKKAIELFGEFANLNKI